MRKTLAYLLTIFSLLLFCNSSYSQADVNEKVLKAFEDNNPSGVTQLDLIDDWGKLSAKSAYYLVELYFKNELYLDGYMAALVFKNKIGDDSPFSKKVNKLTKKIQKKTKLEIGKFSNLISAIFEVKNQNELAGIRNQLLRYDKKFLIVNYLAFYQSSNLIDCLDPGEYYKSIQDTSNNALQEAFMDVTREFGYKECYIVMNSLVDSFIQNEDEKARLRAKVYFNNNKIHKSIEQLELIKDKSDYEYRLLARCYKRINNNELAFNTLNNVFKKDSLPKDAFQLAKNLYRLDDNEKSKRYFQLSMKDSAYYAKSNYWIGTIYFDERGKKNFRESIKYFDCSIQANPNFSKAIFKKAKAHWNANENDKALESINRAIKADNKKFLYWEFKWSLLKYKDSKILNPFLTEARENFEEIYSNDSLNHNSLIGFGYFKIREMRKLKLEVDEDKWIRLMLRGLELYPYKNDLFLKSYDILDRNPYVDFEPEMIELNEKWLEAFPRNGRPYIILFYIYLELHNYAKANYYWVLAHENNASDWCTHKMKYEIKEYKEKFNWTYYPDMEIKK